MQDYQEASDSWTKYLKATDEPAPNLAQLMAPTLITLAELSRTYPEAQTNLEAAAEAQQVVADQRPTLNSYTTLAFYTYFTGDYAARKRPKRSEEAGQDQRRRRTDRTAAETDRGTRPQILKTNAKKSKSRRKPNRLAAGPNRKASKTRWRASAAAVSGVRWAV